MAYNTSSLINIIDTLNGLEGQERFDFLNTIFLTAFKDKDIKKDVILLDQVRNGDKMPIFLEQEDWSAFATAAGNCSYNQCDISDDWSDYTFKVGKLNCEVTICFESFATDFNRFFRTYWKGDESDLANAVVQFLAERMQSKQLKAEMRVYFFGDSSVTANG